MRMSHSWTTWTAECTRSADQLAAAEGFLVLHTYVHACLCREQSISSFPSLSSLPSSLLCTLASSPFFSLSPVPYSTLSPFVIFSLFPDCTSTNFLPRASSLCFHHFLLPPSFVLWSSQFPDSSLLKHIAPVMCSSRSNCSLSPLHCA